MNRSSFPIDRARRRRIPAMARAAACAATLLLAAGAAQAQSAPAAGTPEAMILELSAGVLDAIRKDKAIQAGDFDRVQKLVTERIMPSVDFDKMTRLTVGRPWRSATPEQRATLIEQFRILLLRTYSGALSKVTDQQVRLRPSHGQDAAATDVIVRTQIVSTQGDPVGLDYRMEKTDKGWLIYDLNILGVWLVENYRNEFLESLNQGGVDALIRTLSEKNRLAAAGAKAS
jgi:phospholipid transport system substrate-binding protein